jgi:hypothetical protein
MESVSWWPVEPPEGDDPETHRTLLQRSMTTANEVTVTRDDAGDTVISYSVPGEIIGRTWAVIFRNGEGEIVGGVYPDLATGGRPAR